MHNNDIPSKLMVLSLNGAWQRIRYSTVGDAFIAMNGGSRGTPPALGMDIGFAQLPDGTWDTSEPIYTSPVAWDEWIKLPVRPFDFCIRTAKLTIRVPTVMVAPSYLKMPVQEVEFSADGVYERDKGICQYSGVFVGRDGGNLEHVNPKGRGGEARCWMNTVWSDRRLNTLKGGRTLEEMGWKLIRQPVKPKPLPVCVTLREMFHADWRHFRDN